MAASLDLLGIGNAIVDVLSHEEDAFLDRHGLIRGEMRLIDTDAAERLYADMGPGIEISGGSAANTLAGFVSLGGRGAYIGKVADDQLGKVFAHDLRATGVQYETPPLVGGDPTARCLIAVTPDAQRTMSTYLGASVTLGTDDIDAALVAAAQVTYLEGYLFDPPEAKAAFAHAAEIAHHHDRQVALTLSDSFCVERHRAALRHLVEHHIDILFANEAEIIALYEADSFATAMAAVRGHCDTVCLTRSEKGSVVMNGGGVIEVPAAPVDRLVDTTGAGDLYAAGFLFGHVRGEAPAECGRIGAICAAEVISQMGARPQRRLADLLAQDSIATATGEA